MSKLGAALALPLVRRIVGVALIAAYTPTFLALAAIVPTIARNLQGQGGFFGFAVCTAASYAVVTFALLGAVVSVIAPAWRQKALGWCQVALVLYWLPHALIVGFWCVMVDRTGWID